jgi:hypothetical protein
MGAYDYFNKPFERDALLETVRGAFEYRRLKVESRFTAWAADNVGRLLSPLVNEHLFVSLADGSSKHVRDLAEGDTVPFMRDDGLHQLHFAEKNGKLTATESVTSSRT